MTAAAWIAHVLAVHLAVLQPVEFHVEPIATTDRCAVLMRAEAPARWAIVYDEGCWRRHPARRAWMIAHELCHAARGPDDRKARGCADRILAEHLAGDGP